MTTNELPAKSGSADKLPQLRTGLLIALSLMAGCGTAWLLKWSGEQAYSGSLQSRTTSVTTNCHARIREVNVKTGQAVVPGDVLFQLVDVQLEDRLIAKRREIAELEAEVSRSRIVAEVDIAWRRRELQAETFETQLKEAALVQEKLNKQVEQLAWKEYLAGNDTNISAAFTEMDHPFRSISNGLQAPDDRRLQAMLREDAAAAAAEALTTQIALCEQRLKNLASLEKDLETKIRSASGVAVNEARLNGARTELAALESQLQELTITSPTYGVVGEVKHQPGERVAQGVALVDILDDVPPHVVAQLPAGTASKLRHGVKVALAFPENGQRIGIVSAIPPKTTLANGTTDAFVPVKIEPAGKLWPRLAIGSNVKVMLQ